MIQESISVPVRKNASSAPSPAAEDGRPPTLAPPDSSSPSLPFAAVGAGLRAKSRAVPAAADLLLPAREAGDAGSPCAGGGAPRWTRFRWRLRSSRVAAAPGDAVAMARLLGGGAARRPAAALSWPRSGPFWAPSGLGRARSGISVPAPGGWWRFSC
jgi:hypothetical protein